MKPPIPGFIRKPLGIVGGCVLFFCVVLVPTFFISNLLFRAGEYLAVNLRYSHDAWTHGLRIERLGHQFTNGDAVPFWLKNGREVAAFLPTAAVFFFSLILFLLLFGTAYSWIDGDSSKNNDSPPSLRPEQIPVRNWKRLFSALEIFVVFAIFYGIALCITHKYDVGEHPLIMSIYQILSAMLTPMVWTFLGAISVLLLASPFFYHRSLHTALKAWLTGAIGLVYFIGFFFGWWLR